jgi:hypothetical protein
MLMGKDEEIGRLRFTLRAVLKVLEEAPCGTADPWVVESQKLIRIALRVPKPSDAK